MTGKYKISFVKGNLLRVFSEESECQSSVISVVISVVVARRRGQWLPVSPFYRHGDVIRCLLHTCRARVPSREELCTPVVLEVEMGSSRGQQVPVNYWQFPITLQLIPMIYCSIVSSVVLPTVNYLDPRRH